MAKLNFGCTLNGLGYGNYFPGAASIGTVVAATASYKMGWVEVRSPGNLRHFSLRAANLPTEYYCRSTRPRRRIYLLEIDGGGDKKVANGQLRLIFLKGGVGGWCVYGRL